LFEVRKATDGEPPNPERAQNMTLWRFAPRTAAPQHRRGEVARDERHYREVVAGR
jgi:hypothetical protein